jgi:SET family sugar efflux transporter-like MFS transporter
LTDSALRVVLRSRFYRSAFLALVLAGIGVSATFPQLTLFLVRDLGTPLPVAGLYYVTNLAAPLAGYLVGRLSDRSSNRLAWFRVCALVGGAGWLAMASATVVWLPFVVSTLALSISGASMAQLFAACRDELSRHPTSADNRVMAVIRMAFTGGWIVGPVVGSWFGGVFGLRSLLLATAILTVAQLIPLGRQRVERYEDPTVGPPSDGRRRIGTMLPLLLFTAACVLVMTGDTIKFGYLPIYMADQLRISDAERGAVIAIQPLLEFLLMPITARLADRYGPMKVMTVGAAMAVGANLAYATSSSVAGLFVGQALTAGLWACIGALGVTIAQRLYPEGVATASGVFLSSIALSAAVGGAIGGVGVAAIGLPHVFFVPAVLTLFAVVALGILSIRLPVGTPVVTPSDHPAEAALPG